MTSDASADDHCLSNIRYSSAGLDIITYQCELPPNHRGAHRAGCLSWTTPAVTRTLLGPDTG